MLQSRRGEPVDIAGHDVVEVASQPSEGIVPDEVRKTLLGTPTPAKDDPIQTTFEQ